MTSRTQELLLKINGKLDAKFGKAFQTANGKVFDLGQTMAKSTEQVERLNRVVAGRRGVEVLSQKLATAKTRLEALNAQMQATVSPSAKLQRSFQQAQRHVDIYKQRLEQSRQALEREEQATNTVGKTISQVSKIRRQQTGIVDTGARRLEAYSNQLQALDEQMERVKARRQEGIASILEGAALLRGFYEPIQTAMEFEVKTAGFKNSQIKQQN